MLCPHTETCIVCTLQGWRQVPASPKLVVIDCLTTYWFSTYSRCNSLCCPVRRILCCKILRANAMVRQTLGRPRRRRIGLPRSVFLFETFFSWTALVSIQAQIHGCQWKKLVDRTGSRRRYTMCTHMISYILLVSIYLTESDSSDQSLGAPAARSPGTYHP